VRKKMRRHRFKYKLPKLRRELRLKGWARKARKWAKLLENNISEARIRSYKVGVLMKKLL